MGISKLSLGIDIGSTTTKLILMNGEDTVYAKYKRHLSKVVQTTVNMLEEMKPYTDGKEFSVAFSGSAGLGVAEGCGFPFIQEVYATGEVIKRLAPDTSTVIELGGEDAKVIFFDGGIDERMNGTCAGGTGAFIDQMALLLNMTVEEMDKASLEAERLYPIASRCGVFAKTDIQPLLNQGAKKSDVAASIYQAVVNQTLTGLVQGRKITGKVMFLGGPLYYCKGLQKRFFETLKLTEENAVFPKYGLFSVAMGASVFSKGKNSVTVDSLIESIKSGSGKMKQNRDRLAPLFENEQELKEFKERHQKASVKTKDINSYSKSAYLGIDCGSTTTKLVLISEDKEILYSYYGSNLGNPVSLIKNQLGVIYGLVQDRIRIKGSAVTGYGEELIKNAFKVDRGVVETIAHYTAAKYFRPDVDFILDIGGQDIKCFKIRNNAIDSIMLNEACSSGCGSFIETFAKSMGYTVEEFANKGLFGKSPVNLGSRCTVFMNSSVKQSQRDGATVEDISAGLSVSVVKNAIYKVIRATSPKELGKCLVVQGGTFLNDAVLRAFERELGANVIRPEIAGLMGAYGAALYSMKCSGSSLITPDELKNFTHTSKTAICNGCMNKCHLTINSFSGNGRFISGNRCEKGAGIKKTENDINLYEFKRGIISEMKPVKGNGIKVGLPLALSMFELAPLWYNLFEHLGYEAVLSPLSTRQTYEEGQFTIPSDTACYPAKIMHGHITELIKEKPNFIFYPSLTYNVDEKMSDNHYNCPIVAYYGELLNGNMDFSGIPFLYPHLDIASVKGLCKTLFPHLKKIDPSLTHGRLRKAAKFGFEKYAEYVKAVRTAGENSIKEARAKGKRILILAGRPYHIDPEICHGIDKLCNSLGFAVVSEDSVCHLSGIEYVNVLDQWTFHSRLYRSAKFACENKDVQLVQLVSFGCGVDAITTDEMRRILEEGGKNYTQLKIDEITNLGAVKIRLRSLIGALEEKEEEEKNAG